MPRTPEVRLAGQRPLIATVAAVVLAVAVSQQLAAIRGADPADGELGAPVAEAGRTSQVVGPAVGVTVAEYIAERQLAMAEATPEVDTAVVSFVALQTASGAAGLLGEEVEVRAALVRLPMPGSDPITVLVDGDAGAAVQAELAARVGPLREELDETQRLLDSDSITDDAFLADYEDRAAELAAAIEAVESGAPLVHAVVVRGPLPALQALEGVAEVRLVDPAPPLTDVATSVFHGLLPSDEDVTSVGRPA